MTGQRFGFHVRRTRRSDTGNGEWGTLAALEPALESGRSATARELGASVEIATIVDLGA